MKLRSISACFLCMMFFVSCSQEVKKTTTQISNNKDPKIRLRIDSLREAEISNIRRGNYEGFYKKAMMIDSSEVILKINHAYSIAHNKNDYSAALIELRGLFKKYANNSDLLFAYGTVIYSFNPDSAFYYCEKALTLEPKNWLNWLYLSMYYDEQKITQKSLQSINKAIELRPNIIELRLFRGAYKMDLEDYKGAYEDMDTIPKNSKDSGLYINRGLCLYSLKKYELAISDINTYIMITKKPISQAYVIRGFSKLSLKDKEGAYEDLKIAHETDGSNVSAEDTYFKLVDYFKTHKKSN